MISEIYKQRVAGEAINDACQWLVRHRRLAVCLLLLPVFVCSLLIYADYMYHKNDVVEFLVGAVGVCFIATMPVTMLQIVDEARAEGKPERLSAILGMGRDILQNLGWALVAALIYGIGSLTVILPVLIAPLGPLCLAMTQREGLGGIFLMFRYIVDNAVSTIVLVLGNIVIFLSMTVGVFVIFQLIDNHYNSMLKTVIHLKELAVYLAFLGGALACEICIVISLFFYGQCREKADNLSIIDRIENDFLPEEASDN